MPDQPGRVLTDEERAWNEAHGLTATCAQCGGAMKADGREFCSHACYRRSLTAPARVQSPEATS